MEVVAAVVEEGRLNGQSDGEIDKVRFFFSNRRYVLVAYMGFFFYFFFNFFFLSTIR